MEFAEVVRRRRMVRRFDRRPVPREVIDRILDVARRGPSAGFAQGVDFLVLDTPETHRRVLGADGRPRRSGHDPMTSPTGRR